MSKIGNTGGEGFSGSCEGAEKRTGGILCSKQKIKRGVWVAGEVAVSVVSLFCCGFVHGGVVAVVVTFFVVSVRICLIHCLFIVVVVVVVFVVVVV